MSYDGFAVPFLVSHGLLYHMDMKLGSEGGFFYGLYLIFCEFRRLSHMSYDGFAVPFLISHGLLYHMDWNDGPKSRVTIDMD